MKADKREEIIRFIEALASERFTGKIAMSLDYKDGLILSGDRTIPW